MEEQTTMVNDYKDVARRIKGHKAFLCVGSIVVIVLLVLLTFSYELNIRTNISNRKLLYPENMTYHDFFQSLADKYGFHINKITGARHQIIELYSDDFDSLGKTKQFAFFGELGNRQNTLFKLLDKSGEDEGENLHLLRLYSCGHEFHGMFDNTYYGAKVYVSSQSFSQSILYRDNRVHHSQTVYDSSNSGSSSSKTKNTSKAKSKCTLCNGTGTVRYYYGSSALEAFVNGKNDYEWGPCGSCNGTGYK